jgi:hypothetical protein
VCIRIYFSRYLLYQDVLGKYIGGGLKFFHYFWDFRFSLQNAKDNPPCNTLFIGNLGENINEDELRGLFSSYVSLIPANSVSC